MSSGEMLKLPSANVSGLASHKYVGVYVDQSGTNVKASQRQLRALHQKEGLLAATFDNLTSGDCHIHFCIDVVRWINYMAIL